MIASVLKIGHFSVRRVLLVCAAALTVAALLSFAPMPVSWAQMDAAAQAYERGDYAEAHRIWLPLAEEGDATAQYNIGVLYEYGLGVERVFSRAVRWYVRAAENGNADAQDKVGDLYAQGFWGEEYVSEAAIWHRLAAEQRHAEASATVFAVLCPAL